MSISRNAAYNLAGAVIPIVVGLATVPLYLHLIGAERYGVLALSFLLLGYFGLFDLGLGKATTYRIASLPEDARQDRADVLWTSISLNLGMSMVGLAILWAAAQFFFLEYFKTPPELKPEIVASIPILAASLPVSMLGSVPYGALQARHKFIHLNVISNVSSILFQVLPLVTAAVVGPSLPNLLLSALVGRLIGLILLFGVTYATFARGLALRLKGREIPSLLHFGGWVLIDGLLAPLLSTLDRFAIGAVLGAEKVTIFTVPHQLATRLNILPAAVVQVLFPTLAGASDEERRRVSKKTFFSIVAVISPITIAGIFLMRPFMNLWLGSAIGALSGPIGVLILLGVWYNILAWPAFTWLQGTGRPDLVTKLHLLEVPFYLAGLYFALHAWGLYGAALVMLVRNALDLFLLVAAARQTAMLRPIAPIALVTTASAAAAAAIHHMQPLYWLAALVGIPATLALSWQIMPADIRTRYVGRYLERAASKLRRA